MVKFVTNASSAIWWPKLGPILIALHVGQNWNQVWWHHLVVKSWTNTSGSTYNWPNLELIQVAFYLAGEITQVKESGSVVPLAMFYAGSWTKVSNKPGWRFTLVHGAGWSKANRNWVPVVLVKMWGPAGEITKLLSVQISIETAWNDDGCWHGSSGQWWMWGWQAAVATPDATLWSSWCLPPESPLMPPSKLLMPPSSHQQHLQFGCHRKQLFFHYQSNPPPPLFHQIDVLFFGCMVWAHSMWAYGGMLWLLGPWLEVPSLVRWGYQAAMRDGPFLIIFQFMIIDHHNHPWHSSIGRQVDDNVWV